MSRPLQSRRFTTAQGLTDLSAIGLPETSDRDPLIAFRDYGFVDHVELIPPSQLLRVPNVTIAIHKTGATNKHLFSSWVLQLAAICTVLC